MSRRPWRGVLVVGTGDENRGDSGVGLHLMECLEQFHWPGDVVFCRPHEFLARQAEGFAEIIILGAIAGPDEPGSLYHASAEDLLASSLGSPEGAGVLGLFPPALRKRLTIFAMHPQNLQWGSGPSGLVVRAISLAVPFLRSFILRTLGRLTTLQ